MKITFRDIVWFAIVALIVLWLSKCHRDNQNNLQSKANEVIEHAKSKDSIYVSERNNLRDRLRTAEDLVKSSTIEAERSNARLRESLKTITRLSAAVKAAKNLPIDTSFVTVSPEYVTYCDSLAVNSEKLWIEYDGYKSSISDVVKAKDSAINLLSETVKHERNFSAECRKEFAALEYFYKKEIKGAKQRNQIYAGAELIGNQQTIIQNVGAVLSLKTKSNKLWQISSGLQNNGQLYGRVSGSILITFKK